MAMKEQQRAVYRTMQGKEIDMHKLAMQNEMTVAVGNARVNARGDELGPGGKIIRKREDVLREANGGAPSEIRSTTTVNTENVTAQSAPAQAPVAAPEIKPVQNAITVQRYSSKKVADMNPEGDE